SLAIRRFSMELIAIFAVTAMFLATLGIYGVMSYMVSERAHEIGLRMALGAGPTDVMTMVLRQAVNLVGAGVMVGLIGAAIVSRGMSGLLVGVRATDPLSFCAAICLLAGAALVGCYLPARRAVRVDPVSALHG
ncbi:MAG TPA: FtsX-like permease family protein, partial [Gemmatimonadaceae bacterium]|nr:FtsX-like permease family protein [Gemmatimonadaceae bacterium]